MSPLHGRAAASRRTVVRDREDAVVARLQALAPHLDGEPDPDFRAATRARLVAMAAVRTPGPERAAPLRRLLAAGAAGSAPQTWRTRLTAGLAGAALTVTALAGLVAVSTDARPGDVLYTVKRGTEQTQLALTADSQRGQTLLGFASTRLDELDGLVGDSAAALPAAASATGAGGQMYLAADAAPGLVLETLSTMDEQTRDGASWLVADAVTTVDAAPLDRLADWVRGQTTGLAALQPKMPDAVEAPLGGSLGLLSDIGDRAEAVRVALACVGGPVTDGADGLGPVPAPCAPGPAVSSDGGGAPDDDPPAPGSVAGSVSSAAPSPTAPGQTGNGSSGGTTSGGRPSSGSASAGSGSPGGGGLPTTVVPPAVPRGGLPSPPSTPLIPPPGPGPDLDTSLPLNVCITPLPPLGSC